MTDHSGQPFGRASAATVLDEACHRVGLNPNGAELVRLGENAIYRLRRGPVVVRIARSMDHWSSAEKEIGVAEWLSGAGLRAART